MSQYNTSQTPLPEPLPAADELAGRVARSGQRLGPYTLRALIGEGPFGGLFHADQTIAGVTKSAMVRVIPHSLSTAAALQRYVAEQQQLAATGSAHFFTPGDFGETADGFYLGVPLYAGCDLQTALAQSGGIHRRKALEIARQICAALEVAHQAGVVHGGLSPQSIHLVASGNELLVKILDFGAHALGARPGALVILGDPAYLAPEQFSGETTRGSDVYSLALIVYELLSGKRLCDAAPAVATAQKLAGASSSSVPAPSTLASAIDNTLGALLERSLSADPRQRPPSVLAFRRSLVAWAERSPSLLDGTADLVLEVALLQQERFRNSGANRRPVEVRSGGEAARSQSGGAQVSLSMQSNGKSKLEAAPTAPGAGGQKPSSESESVEASLEEFINQANASFPTSDGWDLHTGDVELVDPEPDVEDDDVQAVSDSDATSVTTATEVERKRAARATDDLDLDAPSRPSKAQAAVAAAGPRTTQSFGSGTTAALAAKAAEAQQAKSPSKSMPAVEPAPEPAPAPKKTTSKAMPVAAAPAPAPVEEELPPLPKKTSKSMPAVAAPVEEPAPAPAPKRTSSRSLPAVVERTEVVAQPLPPAPVAAAPAWTSNPLVVVVCMTIAFVVGAGALYLMTRSMQQPIVVQAPAPAPAPVAAPAAPVVTALPPTQPVVAQPAQPVVTPLPAAEQPKAAAVEQPTEPSAEDKVAAIRAKLAAKSSKPEKKAAAPAKEPKAAKASEPKPAKEPKAAPAAKAAAPKEEKKPAKEAKPAKGGDWVDPF